MPWLTRERQLVLLCRQLIWAQGGGLAQPCNCHLCGYSVTDSSCGPACSSYGQTWRKPQCQHCACVPTLWCGPPLPAWGGPWFAPTRDRTPVEASGLRPPPTCSLGWAPPRVLVRRQQLMSSGSRAQQVDSWRAAAGGLSVAAEQVGGDQQPQLPNKASEVGRHAPRPGAQAVQASRAAPLLRFASPCLVRLHLRPAAHWQANSLY